MEKDRILQIMEKEGVNATQFAVEIGVKGPTLSHILNGRNNPSLDVIKRILERYRTISSDWLILGVGSMYRDTKHSQMLSLFDTEEDIDLKSITYSDKNDEKSEVKNANEEIKSDKNSDIAVNSSHYISVRTAKSVQKIIVYYDDNTFQEFYSQ